MTIFIWLQLPLLPLPEVVLFPNSLIPLHIYESRYRKMITDIMNKPEEERLFIIVTKLKEKIKDGFDVSEFYKIGTIGRIVHHEQLEDGRSNILVVGAYSAEIKEIPFKSITTPYRQATLKMKNENWNINDEILENEKLLNALRTFGENYRYQIPDLSDRPLRELLPQLCFGLPLTTKDKINLLTKFKMTQRLKLLLEILKHKPIYIEYKSYNSDTRLIN